MKERNKAGSNDNILKSSGKLWDEKCRHPKDAKLRKHGPRRPKGMEPGAQVGGTLVLAGAIFRNLGSLPGRHGDARP